MLKIDTNKLIGKKKKAKKKQQNKMNPSSGKKITLMKKSYYSQNINITYRIQFQHLLHGPNLNLEKISMLKLIKTIDLAFNVLTLEKE